MILLHHIQIIESFFGIFLFTIANPGVSQLPLHKEGTRLAPNQHKQHQEWQKEEAAEVKLFITLN